MLALNTEIKSHSFKSIGQKNHWRRSTNWYRITATFIATTTSSPWYFLTNYPNNYAVACERIGAGRFSQVLYGRSRSRRCSLDHGSDREILCRFLTARRQVTGLEIDESNLTGETRPVRKQTNALQRRGDDEIPIVDRSNMALMGTLIR